MTEEIPYNALLSQIGDVESLHMRRPLVSLELFFNNNNVYGSIMPNLDETPDPQDLYKTLKKIREQDGVNDVLVAVTQFELPDEEWPFSDTVYFITNRSVSDIKKWIGKRYRPDECLVDPDFEKSFFKLPQGYSAVVVWWD